MLEPGKSQSDVGGSRCHRFANFFQTCREDGERYPRMRMRMKHAMHFKRNAEAGMVIVNLATAGVDFHVPFGGRKGSIYGPREQGRYAAEFYTTVKTAYTLP